MDSTEFDKLVKQEQLEQYETLKKCLFTGTEHIAGGRIVQAYGYINQLLEDSLFTYEGLLRVIGSYVDMKLRTRKS